jgi:hypothetical protein
MPRRHCNRRASIPERHCNIRGSKNGFLTSKDTRSVDQASSILFLFQFILSNEALHINPIAIVLVSIRSVVIDNKFLSILGKQKCPNAFVNSIQ